MSKKTTYLNRDFQDYRESLKDFSKKYYPNVDTEYNDASVGSWLIDINADVADNLNFHIDRTLQETNINTAHKISSVMTLARNNGFKVPGPKGAMAEVKFSCRLPITSSPKSTTADPFDQRYAPLIKKGTVVTAGNQMFEVSYDVDFSKAFDVFGNSDRTIIPVKDSNGTILSYEVSKLAVVVAGQTKIYKKEILPSDIVPFMEIIIPVKEVMNVESIIVKDGRNQSAKPEIGEFLSPEEEPARFKGTTRFFEVDSLSRQERWGETYDVEGKVVRREYGYLQDDGQTVVPAYHICKGEWKPVHHKFITEYTDKGYLKIVFGPGEKPEISSVDISGASDFSRYQITRMLKNNSLGYLPTANSTMYVMYRCGGGKASNVAVGAINNISYLNAEVGCYSDIDDKVVNAVTKSISVVNTTPSVSGKDMPSAEEIKHMIKYNSAAQERCVTVKDYKNRISLMPPQYGAPFKTGVNEENNKIMVYMLGLNNKGQLSTAVPSLLATNISNYLSEYRMITDFVEMKAGKIVNLGFDVKLHMDKGGYSESEVKDRVAEVIRNYMDVNRREMGEDIYVGDLLKEIGSLDGVINVISIRVYNKVGQGYSDTMTSQAVKDSQGTGETQFEIDLEESDYIIFNDGDTMAEIKNPYLGKDINVTIIAR